MKSHVLKVVGVALGISSIGLTSGCEDAAAKQRDVVQVQLKEATQKLQVALAGGSGEEVTTQPLTNIVAELGRIESGEPGQNGAKAMLTATALREVARIRSVEIDRMEADHRLQRSNLETQVNAIARLTAQAAALEGISSESEREQLARDLNAAKTEIVEVKAKLEQLDGPISEHVQQISAAKRQVDELRLNVNDLRRRAQELGHANGLETYLQAVTAGRQADKIEYDISQREIDMEYSLTPELVMTDSHAQQLDAMIKSIESALASLEAFSAATTAELTTTRSRLAEQSLRVIDGLKSLESQRTATLEPAYEEAAGALDRAAGQLRQVQGESMQAARMAALEIQQSLGRLHWNRASALNDHKQLLEAMKDAGGPLTTAVDNASLAAINTAHGEAVEQARTAYTTAQELSTQVQGGSMAALTNNLGRAVTALGGTAMPSMDEPPPVGDTPAVGDASSASFGPFQTPQELLAFWGRTQTDPAAMRASFSFMHATTPTGQRWVKASSEVTNAMLAIDDAMKAKFGQGLLDQLGPMAAMMAPDYSAATPLEQTEDRAVFSFQQMGQSLKLVLRRVDGGWMMDFDELDPILTTALPQMEQMGSALTQGASGLVSRIQSGEFATAQDVMAAFGQIMMNAAGGMGGTSMPSTPPGGM